MIRDHDLRRAHECARNGDALAFRTRQTINGQRRFRRETDLREEWEEWPVTPESADARLDAVPAADEPSLRRRWQQAFGQRFL